MTALGVISLFALLPFHDVQVLNVKATYDRAWQLFLHGRLERSQREAERGYIFLSRSDPEGAAKFLLLEAQVMVWRGQDDQAIGLLSRDSLTTLNQQDKIRRLAIESIALFRQQNFTEANRRLAEADQLCAQQAYSTCGDVFQAHGILLTKRGLFDEARGQFEKLLHFARANKDRYLEASAALNLGWIGLQAERYDESVVWSRSALEISTELDAADMEEKSSSNLGWAYFKLGDRERALNVFLQAKQSAEKLGNTREVIKRLQTIGYVYQKTVDPQHAIAPYLQALELAKESKSKEGIVDSLEVLGHLWVEIAHLEEAQRCIGDLEPLMSASGEDKQNFLLLQGELAAARRQDGQAVDILRTVERDPASQISIRLEAEHSLAKLYESENNTTAADKTYQTALTTFESARAQLKNESSKLPFVANATDIYDDYIHFLVEHNRSDEALSVADQSRGRTLEQGLGLIGDQTSFKPVALHPAAIARQQSSTLLFYWLGEKQSYLWAITPRKTQLFTLPPQRQIAAVVERYRNTLLGPTDPLASADPDGLALYNMLVAPARDLLRSNPSVPNPSVIVLTDGVLSQLNFETLIAPAPAPHYFIEDATLVSAQSLYILASARKPAPAANKLLLLGNARSIDPDFPELASAPSEMEHIGRHFPSSSELILNRASATPVSYLAASPQDYSFIHFVAHGAASRTDPLDSAIILSPGAAPENAYKLYARDIIQHPINARLVTISACSGSGSRSYSGEGLVGLSWAFLRAGAHNVIAALWEVSDNSTPDLMNDLYDGMQRGLSPSAALRNAKLAFLHSQGRLRKPFYWAPFQVYTGL